MALLVALCIAGCGGGGGAGSSTSDGTTTSGAVIEAVPAQVTDVSATATGSTIQLSFTVSNPQNVTGFETVCTGNGPSITTHSNFNGSGTAAVVATVGVTGLTDAQSYSCTVSAVNSSGAGIASSSVQATSSSTAAKPTSPGVLSVTGAARSAVISFSESTTDDGSAVSSYIGICLGNGVDKVSYSYAVASPIVVVGLAEGVPYTCWVSGLNAQGAGKASASYVIHPTAAVAVAADAPAAPTGIAVTRGIGSASVAFTTTTVQASASKRRAQRATAQGVATGSGTLYRATCSRDDGKSTVSVESTASPITVPQLTNGSGYTCSVTATTAAGMSGDSEARPVTPGTLPDAPALTGASAGDTIATLVFTAPSVDGGAAITGYRATCASGTHTASVDVSTAGSVVVAGLVNDNTYGCSVAAINAVGTGAASDPLRYVIPAASTAPVTGTVASTPTVEPATTGNGGAIFVATATSTSPVLDYTATCTAASISSQVSATSRSSPITVTGLSSDTTYDCVVTARTEAGNSAASAPQKVTVAATAPAAPTNVKATPDDAAIAVAFTPGRDGGSTIKFFTATCGDKSNSASASPVTVSGLDNGSIYACTVTATNAVDTSEKSGSDSARPRTVPKAPPTSVSATAGTSTITVAYTAVSESDNGGADITGYTASCQSGNKFYVNSGNGTATSITVPVLSIPDGSTYDCTVTASNTAGPGAVSEIAKATPAASVVETAPDAATNLQMTIGDSQLTVTFDRPASNVGNMSYALICSPGGINMLAVNGSATATGLQNGSTYTCFVRATRGTKKTDSDANAVVSGTPNLEPAAPTLGTVVLGDGRVTIPFTALPKVSYSAACGSGSESVERSGDTFVVNGLSNGQNYTCSVTASNSAGDTSSSTLVTLPAAPTKPILSDPVAGNGSATLTFSPNSESNITYTATCGASGETTTTNTNKSITVSGLTNGSTYSSCTVTATNTTGVTATSSQKPVALPAAPTKPTLSDPVAGNGSATLTFSPNSESNITYTATCGASGETTTTNTNKSITVSGLTNGSTYSSCTVTATNTTGVTATSFQKPVALPAAPTRPILSDPVAGNGSATLTFSPNSESNITYTATCGASGETTTTNANKSITVTGLTNGSTYSSCTVTATNKTGVTATSSQKPVALPAAPTRPILSDPVAGNGSATLTFSPNSESNITYTATCGASGETTTTNTNKSITVSGLTNGSTYSSCTVTATNKTGVAATSVPKPVTPYTVPDTPSITAVSQSGFYNNTSKLTAVTVSYQAPAWNGGSPITGYTVRWEVKTSKAANATVLSSGSVSNTGPGSGSIVLKMPYAGSGYVLDVYIVATNGNTLSGGNSTESAKTEVTTNFVYPNDQPV